LHVVVPDGVLVHVVVVVVGADFGGV